jgi:hypothetical protein
VKSFKPIICLDFDGVVHSYTSGWKGPRTILDAPMPGALKFIATMSEYYEIHIFSSRSHYFGGRRAMKKYLYKQFMLLDKGIGFYQPIPDWLRKKMNFETTDPWITVYRDMVDSVIKEIKFPKHKPPAKLSIDDRAIQFKGKWPTKDFIDDFKPYTLPKELP